MQYRELGKDGPEVPVIGFGAWAVAGGMGHVDGETAIATVRAAIDNGVTLIDTAQAYYNSEEIIGKALKGGYRDRCFLATKVSTNYSREDILSAMENSLRKLDVDYVDLYQIHGWDPTYPIAESMETMAKLVEQGKTRYIGVSNFSAEQMQQALQIARFHSNQPGYNMFNRQIEAEVISYCQRTGIGILAHSSLAKGLLTGRYKPDHKFPKDDERSDPNRRNFQGETFAQYLAVSKRLQEVAYDKGLSLVQLAISWLLRLPPVTCALVGARNPDQIVEHVGAVGVTFSDDELARIDTILEDAPKE